MLSQNISSVFLQRSTTQLFGGVRKKIKKSSATEIKWNLGVVELVSEWKLFFSMQYLKDDLIAGLVVACAAVPLSLAIALASGVNPSTGLVTAIVGGITCALMAGTPLAVSGPAAAMAVLVNSVVVKFGIPGLLIVTLLCGLFQLITGALRLGKLIQFVPTPVVMGFTAGIGAIIFAGQFPRALGLPAPDPSHICTFLAHISELMGLTNPYALLLALSAVLIMLVLPRIMPKFPAALAAVVLPSSLAAFFGLTVERIGTIPSSLPLLSLEVIGSVSLNTDLILAAVTIYALASLETLLSSSAVDKLSKSKSHDSDQELIGQGLGNIVSAFFGGIPVTGVIARSALNVQAGGKTRRAAIFHALFLLITVYVLAGTIGQIPISVLAGILLAVAIRMLNPKEILELWKTSKSDALVYGVTFIVIVSVGLLAGIQAGIIAALLVAALRLSQLHISAEFRNQEGPFRVSLVGPLTFLSVGHIRRLRKSLSEANAKTVLFDVSRVSLVDKTGAESFSALLAGISSSGTKFVLLNAAPNFENMLLQSADNSFKDVFAATEAEAQNKLQDRHPIHRLIHGVQLHRWNSKKNSALFEKLSNGQSPHTLIVTCSDSRIDPTLITSSHPGELFVVRNVGNLIPKYGTGNQVSEQAALEYSLNVLDVKELIVCGHSGCGAVQAMLKGIPSYLPGVSKWLTMAMGQNFLQCDDVNVAAKVNVLQQVENLMGYDVVREKVQSGKLRVHGWFYDIAQRDVYIWDTHVQSFVSSGDLIGLPRQNSEAMLSTT